MLWIIGLLLGVGFFWWTTKFDNDAFGVAPLLIGFPGFFAIQWFITLLRVWGFA